MIKYESYKRSEVDWIGEVPKHWEVKRLKNIILNDIGGIWGEEPLDDENDIIVLRVADFDRIKSRIIDNPDFTYRNIQPSQLKDRKLSIGDILLEKSGGGELQPVGKAVLFDKDFTAVCSNFINKIETVPFVTNKYALYLLDALYYNSINVRDINQTTGIQNLNSVAYYNEKISLPPLPEQKLIVDYLDEQTQKIDKLISNKKEQIENLKGLRHIEINNAVTKGLNPNVELKDSGIEWVGEIPEHWKVKRLKHLASVKGRIGFRGYTTEDLVEEDEGALTLGATHITSDGVIDLSNPVYISMDKYLESPEIMVQIEDLVIVQRGSTVGKVGRINFDIGHATINPSLVLIKSNKQIQYNFLFYYLIADLISETVNLLTSSTAIPMISQEQIENFIIIVPPLEEQIYISEYLMHRVSKIELLIRNIEDQISKLQELRKIIIYNAVTGKIKVTANECTT